MPAGNARGLWGWSGTCFSPGGASGALGCSAPDVLTLNFDEIDGTAPAPVWNQPFLDSLTADERTAILAYDRLGSRPFTTSTEMDADPRFIRVGEVDADPAGSRFPMQPTWTPCSTVARDEDFPVFASMEVPLSASETLIVEHSWLSTTLDCSTQTLGLTVGTSTPGCLITQIAYLDRMFGTFAFLWVSSRPACTVP
jgi:hypothetical protein